MTTHQRDYMWLSRRMLGAFVTLWGIVVVCACVPTPEPDSIHRDEGADALEAAELQLAAAVQPIWQVAGEFAGPGFVVSGVAVVRTTGLKENLRGYSVATGDLVWHRDSSRGAIAPDQVRRSSTFVDGEGNLVLFNLRSRELAPDDVVYQHVIELVDPASGELRKEIVGYGVSDSWKCGDALCFSGFTDEAPDPADYRVDPESLEIEAYSEQLSSRGSDDARDSRFLAGGVELVATDEGRLWLVKVDHGDIQWRLDLGEVVGVSADNFDVVAGSRVVDSPEGDVFLLDAAWGSGAENDGLVTASDFTATAFDLASGELLWQRDEVLACGERVLCGGEYRLSAIGDSGVYESSAGTVRLEGVDARTGVSRWHREVDGFEDDGNAAGQGGPEPFSDLMVFRESRLLTILDSQSGRVALVGAGAVACSVPVTEVQPKRSFPDLGEATVVVGTRFEPCSDARAVEWTEAAVLGAEARAWDGGSADAGDMGDGGLASQPQVHVVVGAEGLLAFEF